MKKIILSFLCIIFLSGCAAPTVYINESPETPISKYKKIYISNAEKDPRKIQARIVRYLRELGYAVKVIDKDDSLFSSQGTGFVIDEKGYIITVDHILDKKTEATIWLEGKRYECKVIYNDEKSDIALLKTKENFDFFAKPLIFADHSRIEMGQEVYVIGFPLSKILGNRPRLTKGLISSTVGLKDNSDQIQISAEIQPGNSGSPLLDEDGYVIGIIQKTLNPINIFERSGGSLPQNVNFAEKAEVVKDSLNRSPNRVALNGAKPLGQSFDDIGRSVVKVRAGIISDEEENEMSMICIFQYNSIWDMWFRFTFFNVDFYDFDTGEHLMRASQYGDNPFSTETSILEKIFEEIRIKLGIAPAQTNPISSPARTFQAGEVSKVAKVYEPPPSILPKEHLVEKFHEDSATLTAYNRYLYKTIAGAVVKPKATSSGVVNAAFTLNSNGTVKEIKFLEGSSENSSLRLAVAKAINDASPFPPFPNDVKSEVSKTFNISIEFK